MQQDMRRRKGLTAASGRERRPSNPVKSTLTHLCVVCGPEVAAHRCQCGLKALRGLGIEPIDGNGKLQVEWRVTSNTLNVWCRQDGKHKAARRSACRPAHLFCCHPRLPQLLQSALLSADHSQPATCAKRTPQHPPPGPPPAPPQVLPCCGCTARTARRPLQTRHSPAPPCKSGSSRSAVQ